MKPARHIIITLAILVMADVCFAQPGGGGPGEPPLPISGVEWLLAAGGIFGFKKVYQIYRKKGRP